MQQHSSASHKLTHQANGLPPTHGERAVAAEVLKTIGAQLQRHQRHMAAVHGLQAEACIADLKVGLRDQLPSGLQQLHGGQAGKRVVGGGGGGRQMSSRAAIRTAQTSLWFMSSDSTMPRPVQEAPAPAGNLRPSPAALPAARTFFSSAPCTSRASNMLRLLQTAATPLGPVACAPKPRLGAAQEQARAVEEQKPVIGALGAGLPPCNSCRMLGGASSLPFGLCSFKTTTAQQFEQSGHRSQGFARRRSVAPQLMAALASSLTAAASRMISSIGRVARAGQPGLSALQRAPQRAAAVQPLQPPLPPLRAWLGRRPLSSSTQPPRPPRAAASQPEFADVDLALPSHCSGCGVPLQREDPNAAG